MRANVGFRQGKNFSTASIHLSGLTAAGVLPPAKANSVRATLQTMLSHLGQDPVHATTHLGDAEVRALRDQPELLRLLAPLLPDANLATIMSSFKDEPTRE